MSGCGSFQGVFFGPAELAAAADLAAVDLAAELFKPKDMSPSKEESEEESE